MGTRYSGFQVQLNTLTIQSEVEKALQTFFSQKIMLTGSSRTDAGVHALQNFFHFDTEIEISKKQLYNLNAILPADIVLKNIYSVSPTAHARFDAVARSYKYFIYQYKNAFLRDRAYYYPYPVDINKLSAFAEVIRSYQDFTSFSKRNTQVKTFICSIYQSEWILENDILIYEVKGNRFLRGMVRGLVGTMLRLAKEKKSEADLKQIIEARNCSLADFAAPPHGLFLQSVEYPQGLLS
jgi:tRNA pseudouridine38-40 synthase